MGHPVKHELKSNRPNIRISLYLEVLLDPLSPMVRVTWRLTQILDPAEDALNPLLEWNSARSTGLSLVT